jgi:hypothetical protein
MLLAAKSLLATVATPLTPNSDAFTIARSVLTVQDAVELALAAICVEDGEDHKIAEKIPFTDLVQRILSRHGDATTKDADRNNLFALNYARIRFKHHGDLLDPGTAYGFLEQALIAINRIVRNAIGVSIQDIDGASAVQDDNIAGWYRQSYREIDDSDFRASLCSTAEGLAATFWKDVNTSIDTGKPNSEDALILSGRGIDPATFLAMQRLLPEANPLSNEEPKFKLREYGHELNWTEQNARFCIESAIGITMRLQHAPTIPEARRFYDEFEDVLTVTKEEDYILDARLKILYSFFSGRFLDLGLSASFSFLTCSTMAG